MAGNITKRGAVWYLRVRVQGREVFRSLRTGDRKLAQQRAKAALDQLNREAYGGRRYTWQEAVEAWAGVAPDGLKPATFARYCLSLRAVDQVLGASHLDEIGRKHMAAIASRPSVTNASRRRDLTAVSMVIRHAQALGWIEDNPALAFPRRQIRERRDPIVLPTEAEIEHLVEVAGKRVGALVRLLAHTGMRLEEAVSLTWRQVDLNRRVITLEQTKAGRVRALPLDDAAVRALSGAVRHVACDWVFWRNQREPTRYTQASEWLWRLRRRAGVAWRTHDLRHWFAVQYLQKGGSIYQLQAILGHSTIATTELYLQYLTPDEVRVVKQGVA